MTIYTPKGSESAPLHKHEGSETIFVTHGKGKFGTKDGFVLAEPGDVIYYQPGEEHYLENVGSQTLEFIWIYSQPGDEDAVKKFWVPVKNEE